MTTAIVITMWVIAGIITAYGASRAHLRQQGEISLLCIVGYTVMNIIPPVAFVGAIVVIFEYLGSIKFVNRK